MAGVNVGPEERGRRGDFETKKEILSCHASRDARIQAIHGGTGLAAFIEVQTGFPSTRADTRYAEGFRA